MSPRKKVKDPWPFPGDSPLDRARRTADSYRTGLMAADPDACAKLDAQAIRRGQGWIVPQRATYQMDDLVTAELLADYCYVKVRTVDEWVQRGLKVTNTPDGNRFRIGDYLDYQADQRRRRAATREASAKGDHCGTVRSS